MFFQCQRSLRTVGNVRQIERGDHAIVVGEVEGYQTFEGEPLVFHSGFYRVATRHPDLDT